MTPTLAPTSLFELPPKRQPQAKTENTAATKTAKKLHDGLEIAAAEISAAELAPEMGRFVHAAESPWIAPKKGRLSLGVVVVLHLALMWGLQSAYMHKVKQDVVAKNVLMTYFAPLKADQTPAQKSPPKTVKVTRAVTKTPSLVPVIPVVENIIETATKPLQVVAQALEVVASPAPAVPPKTIISGVEYIQAPQPVYPALAKRAGEQGKVLLRVLLSDQGLPESVDLQKSSGFARLDEAAKQAVMRARFKPYLENGKALAVYVIVPITFQLDR